MGVLMKNYETRTLKSNDINNCYELFVKNHAFYDEFIERTILPRDFLTLEEFNSTLKNQENTRGIVTEEYIPLDNKSGVACRSLCGFVVYETSNSGGDFVIKIIETASEDKVEIYKVLIAKTKFVAKRSNCGVKATIAPDNKELYKIAMEMGVKEL